MLIQEKAEGNIMFHVALNAKDGTLQKIVSARLPWDLRLLHDLLQTEKLGSVRVDSPYGSHYLFLFDGRRERPYPSVMIWRFADVGDDKLLIDMDEADVPAAAFAERNYLLPEGMAPRTKQYTVLHMKRKGGGWNGSGRHCVS